MYRHIHIKVASVAIVPIAFNTNSCQQKKQTAIKNIAIEATFICVYWIQTNIVELEWIL